jgi:hypothetical protein
MRAILRRMKLVRSILTSLPPVGILLVQLACGSDVSGPNHVATSIAANSSTTLTAPPGAVVMELPSVLVRDEAGSPMGGAPVTFVVTGGGGSVTGGTLTTGPSGTATVGSWKLGSAAGPNTLEARSGNLSPVTFSANGFNPCANTTPYTLASSIDAELSLTDCKLADGSFVDFYSVSIPTGGTYIFTQTSTAFDTFLALLNVRGAPIGVNDNFGNSTNSLLKEILATGTYTIAANSAAPNATGKYTLASAASTTPVTNCEDVFLVPGISSPQTLQTTDCTANGFYYDNYVVFLTLGQSITVSMTSSAVDSYLEISAVGNPAVLASNDNIDPNTKDARIVYAAPAPGFYVIKATSAAAGATGDYTLSVQ